MENNFEEQRVETNSVADLDLGVVREDSADPMADLPRTGMSNNGMDPAWAGDAEVMAAGPRTCAATPSEARCPMGVQPRFHPARPVGPWCTVPAWSKQHLILS